MPRAKGGAKTRQRRKKILKKAKGYVGGRRRLYRTAAETVLRAGRSPIAIARRRSARRAGSGSCASTRPAARRGCRTRCSWPALKKAGILLDRKVLAELAVQRSRRVREARRDRQGRRSAKGSVTHPRVDAVAREARAAIDAAPLGGRARADPRPRSRPSGGADAAPALARPTPGAEERPLVGAAANEAKRELEALLDGGAWTTRARASGATSASAQRPDLTLPGRRPATRHRPSAHPGARRDRRDLRGARLLGGRGAGDRDRLLQLRGAQHAARPSGARHAGHVLPLGRHAPAHPHLARADPRRCRRSGRRCGSSCRARSTAATPTSPTRRCSTRSRGWPWTDDVTMADLKGTLELFAREMFGAALAHPLPPVVLPVHRALGRGRRAVLRVRGRRMPAVQAVGLARDPGLGHGASSGAAQRRLRSRGGHRLGLRHGHRAHRHAASTASTTSGCSSRTTCASCGSSHDDSRAREDSVRLDARVRRPRPGGRPGGRPPRQRRHRGGERHPAGSSRAAPAWSSARSRPSSASWARARATACACAGCSTGRERYAVVCGAPNAGPGVRAAFAPPGAVLPGGRRIEAAKIRGVESQGMLCSERELGHGRGARGRRSRSWTADAPLGADLVTHLGLDDSVLEIEITPNRPDCLSVVGVARELAALTGGTSAAAHHRAERVGRRREHARPRPHRGAGSVPALHGARHQRRAVGPSPAWMAARLRAVGLRPISNVVDVTNYVLWELGHPLHAFDYDDGDRRAPSSCAAPRAGERFTHPGRPGARRSTTRCWSSPIPRGPSAWPA